jgi:HK97 family phage portal protein
VPILGATEQETFMRTYGSSGTVFSIVNLLATSVAAPEWKLYRKPPVDGRVKYTAGKHGDDMRVEVVRHQALSVWSKPNDFYTRHLFMETCQQHLELTGECWWIVERDSRATFPTGLWPVRPDRMTPVPSPDKFLAGYIYTGPSGERVPLNLDEVIQIKYPNPLDPYRGMGPVQSILVDIDAMRYGAEWNRNFFLNSAEPGGIIKVSDELDDPAWDRLLKRWGESHQGVARAHRVAVLEGGAEWQDRAYSMRDMQFSELRNVSRDVIREAWGIHKSMLGNADDVNRANAQTAEEVFGRWKIVPRLDRTRSALNEVFLPMFGSTGEGVEFDYVNPTPEDQESENAELTAKSNAVATLVNAGFDPADACEVVGFPTMKLVKSPAQPPAPQAPVPAASTPPGPDQTAQLDRLMEIMRNELPPLNGHRKAGAR